MTVYYIFVAILCLQGAASLLEGIRYLAFVRRALDEPIGTYASKASVIIPCKGAEAGLEENLRALYLQDYPDYEIVFVVATEADAALPIIRQLIKEMQPALATCNEDAGNATKFQAGKPLALVTNRKVRVIIAGKNDRRSEKVNNLLRAIEEVSNDTEVFVFVDSDARVHRDWLRSLVAPLAEESVGATTGFRWYLPETGGFFSALLSAWNGSVATTLGDHGNNFAWGGSTAILRKTFEKADVRGSWDRAVSDDYALTRAIRKSDLRIAFVPRCLTVTREDASLASLLEFTTRQVVITRIYNPRLWWLGIVSQILFNAVFFGGLLFAAATSIGGEPPAFALALLVTIYLLGSAKGVLRLIAARRMLPQERRDITRLWWAYCLLWHLVSLVYLYNFLRSAATNRILWRGVLYEMHSPTETVVHRR